ncbi:tryptophan--tRNA ligase [bacterium]|nr:tryptophan--tRNA ligase [bacterium]
MENTAKKRIVSGMRSTGKLHFGHYLGVIENWVKLQEDYDCYFFVADWHALTTKFDDTKNLKQDVTDVVIDWLSCGLDPNKCTIYVQSMIPEIAELNIYLGMVTPQNWVERDPTLKDMAKILKTKEGANNIQVSYGLMGYPVLMSADIMMFNAEYVPVGKDQLAHLEITRDIARRFNNVYDRELFVEPQPKLTQVPLLCGLDGNKMGKSFHNDIKISDTAETTAKRIMQAITDRSRIHKEDLGHTDQCEVAYKYWEIFGNKEELEQIKTGCEAGTLGCADCKRRLGCVINEKFAPIRAKRKYYEEHLDEVHEIIRAGSEKARHNAQKILQKVRKAVKMY